jgi:uncharacterized coiled-coil protein SlyX
MSRYSPADRDRILRQSREILERGDKPPPSPAQPAPVREIPLTFEDPVEAWKREGTEIEQRRAEAKAELRREEGDNARVLSALGRIAALEQRIAELEASLAQSDETMRELARGAADFGAAVDGGLARMETKLAELSGKLTELRSLDDVRRGTVLDLPDFRRRVN